MIYVGRLSKLVLGGLLVSLLFACAAVATQPDKAGNDASASVPTALDQSVQSALQDILDETNVPGGIVAYAIGDGEVHVVAAGYADRDLNIPMKPTDRLLSGSTGKSFVAATTISLVESGQLELDAPISTWLGDEDWFSKLPNGADITLRHLLTHRSGLVDHVYLGAFFPMMVQDPWKIDPNSTEMREDVIALIFDTEPLFPAGEGYAYTDTGYDILGLIIEKVTGESLYEEISQHVLNKLGMTETTPSDRRTLPGLVPGYLGQSNPFGMPQRVMYPDGELVYNNALEWAGGGYVTNPRDLALYVRGAYGGDLLPPQYRDEMLKGLPTKEGQDYPRYGMGVGQDMTDFGIAYGHSGWIPGYVSFMGYLPEHEVAVAFQFNAGPSGEIGDPIPLAKDRIIKLVAQSNQ